MLKKYLIFLPEKEGKIEDEWNQCLFQIKDTVNDMTRLVKLNIFVDTNEESVFAQLKKEISLSVITTFSDSCPAFNVTVHPPEKPWKITVEAGYIQCDESLEIISKFCNSVPYVVARSAGLKEVWACGLGSGLFSSDTERAAIEAFDQMRAILEAEQMSFNNIIRQWNFIGSILEVKNENQNYQIFNKVRSENYHKYRSVHSYPAATGVGMKNGGVILDFFAVKAESNLKLIAVDNPDQIRPYDYSQKVLIGKPVGNEKVNQPPQFERAVYLSSSICYSLLVSGTASIIGQDTIGIGDVEKQTITTIENIGKLSDPERIEHLTGNKGFTDARLILMRVYVKYQTDFATVKSVCRKYFPTIPLILIEADICRENLLVEIEAEFSA